MAKNYNPHEIEAKWRDVWPKERDSYTLQPGDEPYYVLDMISYPSSEGLHMGHWRPYTIADVWARYNTLKGKKVLSPVGFDAFGLPAENAAIKNGTPPAEYTRRSITNFSRQIQEMGKMYDWSTVINTSSPEYYKWTQWIFVQLYKHGLAYKKNAPVWWCPKDQTVLANEQVINGECERCGTEVERKQLRQWFLKITDFADDLLNFDGLNWPDRVKTLQTNWIGKSQGAEIDFALAEGDEKITVFTTRPDTLMGVTYLVVAPEHELASKLTTEEHKAEVEAYIAEASKKSDIDRMAEDKEKTGVFTGSYVTHPLTEEKVPVWVADYVVGTYGTGAVMAVPAHDERDYRFAKKYDLPIKIVVKPQDEELDDSQSYTAYGVLTASGEFDGLSSEEAKEKIVAGLEEKGKGRIKTQYRLRDWLVSRQRYWGAPIPIIYCDTCGEQAVNESDLPVLLPEDVEFSPTGGSPLERHEAFKHAACPKCGGDATRETDTLDTFVDSSWYYLRFTSNHSDQEAFSQEQVKAWMPVDFYVGGTEHSILHLLYARFIMKALHRLELVPYHEPFQTFYGNGMVYLNGSKMSKSKGNIVNPDDMVKQYGTDAMRGYILFMGPADQDVEWQENGITGVSRFLQKSWDILNSASDGRTDSIHPAIQKAYKDITDHLDSHNFNRCISSLMIAINDLGKAELNAAEASVLIRLFAPFFPHFAEEIWAQLGNDRSIFEARWPKVTLEAATTLQYAVQVNGKLRGMLEVDASANESAVVEQAKGMDTVQSQLTGKTIQKTIFVAGRIVNFVVK